jgi:hypothetical protein
LATANSSSPPHDTIFSAASALKSVCINKEKFKPLGGKRVLIFCISLVNLSIISNYLSV